VLATEHRSGLAPWPFARPCNCRSGLSVRLPAFLLLALYVTGCCTWQHFNPYCASVVLGTHSSYGASFKWSRTYALAPTRAKAVELMLRETGLLPAACSKGIRYLRGGETEGGWGWAEFECAA
jgi:hypothetical protein